MILGIDVGTQSLKVVVLDSALRVRGQGAGAYQPSYPRPGWVEQAPDLWLVALGPAIAAALRAAGARPTDIGGIGICGQLDGCIAVDTNGEALAPCIIWMDRRAVAETADVSSDQIRRVCGLVLDAGHLAAKARWLKRNLNSAPIARFHQPVSFLVEQLTDRAVIDHALASTTMVYALESRRYDAALLDRFELDAMELPEVAPAESCAGPLSARGAALTGLPPGIPVAVGTGDDFATPLGGGVCTPGQVATVLGTGEVVGALHGTALRDGSGLLETHAYPGDSYFIENPGWLSGGAVAWIGGILGMGDFAALERLAASAPPGCEALSFIPALTGAMAPEWMPGARGCFHGLTPAHGRAHLARAVMEGCAYAMRDVIDRLAELGVATESLLLLGGGARSALWAQIRADVTGRPATIPHNVDTAPIGAAMLAVVAAKRAPDLPSVAAALPRDQRGIAADLRTTEIYDAAYLRYRRLFNALRPLGAGPAPHLGPIGKERGSWGEY